MSRNLAVLIVVLVVLAVGWMLYSNSSTTTTTNTETTGVGTTDASLPAVPDSTTPSSQTATDSAVPQ